MVYNNGKRYDDIFKLEMVKYTLESGKPVAQVARETSVNISTLYRWIKKYCKQLEVYNKQKFSNTKSEINSLQKQLVNLEEENVILKRAIHHITRDISKMPF